MKRLPAIKYFKNLDGLRFFAAFAVIIGHCQVVIYQYQGYYAFEPYANKLASFGVDFFFVLSGFLISNLLIMEVELSGTINIRHFYYRRFLRIWPLYFLAGLLGICTGSSWMQYFDFLSLNGGKYGDYAYNLTDFLKNLFFLGTFSINIQTLLGHINPVSSLTVGHFWSLAIEEQYYLIFAPLMYVFRRHIGVVMLVLLAIGFYFNQLPAEQFKEYSSFQYNFTANRFWYFGLGGAFALFLRYFSIEILWNLVINFFKKLTLPPSVATTISPILKALSSRNALIFIVLVAQLYLLIPALKYLFGAIFYYDDKERVINAFVALLIIMIAVADYSVLTILGLETKVLKYLGKISYGIYIFHIFSIFITYKILKNLGIVEKSSWFYVLCPLVATIIAVTISAVSYQYFEKYFLNLKKKY